MYGMAPITIPDSPLPPTPPAASSSVPPAPMPPPTTPTPIASTSTGGSTRTIRLKLTTNNHAASPLLRQAVKANLPTNQTAPAPQTHPTPTKAPHPVPDTTTQPSGSNSTPSAAHLPSPPPFQTHDDPVDPKIAENAPSTPPPPERSGSSRRKQPDIIAIDSDSDDPPVATRKNRKVTVEDCPESDTDEDDSSDVDYEASPSASKKRQRKRRSAATDRPKTKAAKGNHDDDVSTAKKKAPVAKKGRSVKSKGKGKEKEKESDMSDADDKEVDKSKSGTNSKGMLPDVEKILRTPTTRAVKKSDKTRDIAHFFMSPRWEARQGGQKQVQCCKICYAWNKKKKGGARGQDTFVTDATTLRRHCEAAHKDDYLKWCKANDFEPQLPRMKKAAKGEKVNIQTTLNEEHFKQAVHEPYSDEAFLQAATEWLVATDQPLQALQHPTFVRMINLAARSKNGKVNIPNLKATRAEIVQQLNDHLIYLQKHLNSDKVGKISVTCDCWTSGNNENYLAVTIHWIEETGPGAWELRNALAGFVSLPLSHTGERLGQALFKTLDRIKVAHKVGHVSCDNAENNAAMMREFRRWIRKVEKDVDTPFDEKTHRIRCIAHIVNLATQALLKHRASGKYSDHSKPEAHDDDLQSTDRDEVALIRSIAVKVRSSPGRKHVYLEVQTQKGRDKSSTRVLRVDVSTRWSSTYVMLKRASEDRAYIKEFLKKMYSDRKKASKKKEAETFRGLNLSSDEWERVDLFLELLQIAEEAQQAFSAESYPTLHNTLPALKYLRQEWTNRKYDAKFSDFQEALDAAVDVIDKYYDDINMSEPYVVTMVLDPSLKMGAFTTDSSKDLATSTMQKVFKARFARLHAQNTQPNMSLASKSTQAEVAAASKKQSLQAKIRNSLTSAPSSSSLADDTPEEPWKQEWSAYIDTVDHVPAGMGLVQWWGMNSNRLPTWASLARDYLAIMASSVSSERVFSSAGITISKRRNRLKSDIVEALQVLKTAIRTDLLHKEEGPTVEDEEAMGSDDDEGSDAEQPGPLHPELVITLEDEESDAENDVEDEMDWD